MDIKKEGIMKKYLTIIIVLVLMVGGFATQGEDLDKTEDYYNGYFWAEASDSLKLGYIIGLIEGAEKSINYLFVVLHVKKQISDEVFYNKSSEDYEGPLEMLDVPYKQIIEGVDKYFSDFANKRIPIVDIMELVYEQITGKISDEGIKSRLQMLRTRYSGGD